MIKTLTPEALQMLQIAWLEPQTTDNMATLTGLSKDDVVQIQKDLRQLQLFRAYTDNCTLTSKGRQAIDRDIFVPDPMLSPFLLPDAIFQNFQSIILLLYFSPVGMSSEDIMSQVPVSRTKLSQYMSRIRPYWSGRRGGGYLLTETAKNKLKPILDP